MGMERDSEGEFHVTGMFVKYWKKQELARTGEKWKLL